MPSSLSRAGFICSASFPLLVDLHRILLVVHHTTLLPRCPDLMQGSFGYYKMDTKTVLALPDMVGKDGGDLRLGSSYFFSAGGGVLIPCKAVVVYHRPPHPYDAGTEHVGFSPTRHILLDAPSFAWRREVFASGGRGTGSSQPWELCDRQLYAALSVRVRTARVLYEHPNGPYTFLFPGRGV